MRFGWSDTTTPATARPDHVSMCWHIKRVLQATSAQATAAAAEALVRVYICLAVSVAHEVSARPPPPPPHTHTLRADNAPATIAPMVFCKLNHLAVSSTAVSAAHTHRAYSNSVKDILHKPCEQMRQLIRVRRPTG